MLLIVETDKSFLAKNNVMIQIPIVVMVAHQLVQSKVDLPAMELHLFVSG